MAELTPGTDALKVITTAGTDRVARFAFELARRRKLAGRDAINPTATILSATMMLEHLGFTAAARRLEAAVTAVYAAGTALTPDQGGRATTTQFCEAVAVGLGVLRA